MSVLNWEYVFDATALDHYHRPVRTRPPGRYGFWLLGSLLVLIGLWQLHPFSVGSGRSVPASIALVLKPLSVPTPPDQVPASRTEEPLSVPFEPATSDTGLTQQAQAIADDSPVQAAPFEPTMPSSSISDTRAMLIQQYQSLLAEQQPTATATGATVMDAALLQRLNAIPAARVQSSVLVSSLPDAMGETLVQLGDHCFVTTDLDNQAMRGMKNWWVGLCGAEPKSAISLDGVKVLGAP